MAILRARAWIIPVLVALSACTSFDESDNGDSSKVLLGKTFTVSLPTQLTERIPQIEKSEIVRFLDCRRNTSAGLDIFEFKATGLGESQIHISRDTDPKTPDYVITIKVVLGGSPNP